ncbi:hypothetical protein VIGAN_02339600 [Vigna angularis var. angularis]|uniref:Uncharacterized protein n=1 Tax=Vigna angularis var. angularis TaxID=157739 RepID=A0A0S3RIC4_PHAAN|nr:hypothetical protein VIGAN_02339600 [Vigna angularis var. angularis]
MRCFLCAFYSLPTLSVFPLSPAYVDFLSSTSRAQFDVQVNHLCVIVRNQIKLKILKALYAAAALLDFGTILYSSTQQSLVP